MKMKLNSKKKNTFSRIFISILFILMFYLFLNFFGDFIKKIIIDTKNNTYLYFLNSKEILDKNLLLKKEVQDLKLKNIFSDYYYNKVKELEKRLNFLNDNDLERELFKIFSSENLILKDGLILENKNKSKKENGDLVYIFDNIVLGRVKSVDSNFIKIENFYDINVKANYIIMTKGEVIFKGEGEGESSGIIKLKLPRNIKIHKDSIILLEDGRSIVGIFLRDDFKSQNTEREVYFRTIVNPEDIFMVEI